MTFPFAVRNALACVTLVSALFGTINAAPSAKPTRPAAKPRTQSADLQPGSYGVPIGGRSGRTGRTPLPRKLRVWIIPVANETYASVTPTSIAQAARAVFEVTDPGMIQYLYDLLATESGPGRYSEGYTRVRFQPSNSRSSIYLDREGVVLRGHRAYQLGPRAFVKLAFILDRMSARTDEAVMLRTGRMPKPGTPRQDPSSGTHKMAIE